MENGIALNVVLAVSPGVNMKGVTDVYLLRLPTPLRMHRKILRALCRKAF